MESFKTVADFLFYFYNKMCEELDPDATIGAYVIEDTLDQIHRIGSLDNWNNLVPASFKWNAHSYSDPNLGMQAMKAHWMWDGALMTLAMQGYDIAAPMGTQRLTTKAKPS